MSVVNRSNIVFNFIILIAYCVYLGENIEIECDAISNTEFGRRFCFIRHHNSKVLRNVTFKYNSIADEKREIIFDNCTLNELPLGMFESFPNIKTVYIWHTKLKKLTKEVFQNAKNLASLDLSKNEIAMLDRYTFYSAKLLTHMDLSSNAIESIHVDAFAGLNVLNVLNMDTNKLQFIPSNSFAQLTELKTIRLSHNLIKMIPVELFGQNTRLQNIYLNDNAIEWMFGEQTFRHLQYVNEFDLHNNPSTNLVYCVVNAESINIQNTNSRGCYIGSRTKRILANDNRISHIDSSDAIAKNLEHVELGNNRLHRIKNLTRFEKLSHLDLSNNKIIDIGLNSFANMDKLEVLKLRNSGLSKVHFGSFSHKSKLKILDVSYNHLGNIDFQMFLSMSNLAQLQLDGNDLSEMDSTGMRKIFPVLSRIGISENNWTCQNLATIIKQLEGYGIELNTFIPIKHVENIKGIPCSSGNETYIEENVSSTLEPEVEIDKAHSSTSYDVGKTKNQSSNIPDMHLMLRLLKLKYDLLSSIQSFNEIQKKLDDILNEYNVQIHNPN